ncbi:hypothetical protein O6H91_04G036200 [Diphasiastrum complanatum]|uniref:Uncharacterized protein n=1 Tax=Diphasiastrum complanatum TaxID=34168 RepID=A0ACC2DVU1_DIPCM|nr:hypothetical protein O6H91_04G036200 [Diphasiastrum complanatum]
MYPRELLWNVWVATEVLISALVHFVYAVVIFCSALVSHTAIVSTSKGRKSAKIVPLDLDNTELTQNPTMSLASADQGNHNGTFLEGFEEAPIVLVHGIFGFGKGKLGSISYWAGAENKDNRVLIPDLGSLTSIHDRACELFYYLKGGTVDYGADHSYQCGHARFGRNHMEGHYPEWDENHPVHFVGHSTGVQVVRVLQQMLADKRFKGQLSTSADWVLSVTSLSGALNGTTRVYIDGIRPEDGRSMKTISLLQLLRFGALMYEWLDIPWLKRYYSFGFEHFNLAWHQSGLKGLATSILNTSGPFASGDWILPDLSIQTTLQLNRGLKTNANTYYFRDMRSWVKTICSNLSQTIYRDEDWQDNDGALNTISMLYPRFPSPHPNCPLGPEFKDGQMLLPGIWYHTVLEADHILFIINRDRAGVHFDVLYDSIFQRCRKQMRRSSLENIDHISMGT